MRERVASGAVGQAEVDAFARGFAAILCGLSLASAGGAFSGGELGERLVGVTWAVACGLFLFWLWRVQGAEKLVRFAPFMNLPLKRPGRVRFVATVVAVAGGAGNLLAAIGPR